MAEDTREVLFNIGNREISRNDLYAFIGPSNSQQMVVAYDQERNKSTWVAPTGKSFMADGSGLMAFVLDNSNLEDRFDTPKPYLYLKGGEISFDSDYKPTQEQIEILKNWYQKLDEAGIGGPHIDSEILKQV